MSTPAVQSGSTSFFLFRRGEVPIPDPLPELAGGVVLEPRHVQHATGQLHTPIPFFQLFAGYWVKMGQLLPVLLHVQAGIIGHQARQVHDTVPVRTPDVSILEPVVGHVARIAGQPIAQRDRIAYGPADTRVKILKLPAGYLARLVNANEMYGGTLITQVVAGAGEVAKLDAGARRKVGRSCQRG